jgi:hypothetical protein
MDGTELQFGWPRFSWLMPWQEFMRTRYRDDRPIGWVPDSHKQDMINYFERSQDKSRVRMGARMQKLFVELD